MCDGVEAGGVDEPPDPLGALCVGCGCGCGAGLLGAGVVGAGVVATGAVVVTGA
ncbi:MAG TPA: hypothetical protein VHW04_15655 [Solirubrobacteraceae bacterium]|nr:hypothetical protein [Solirubrobacteraceae bacterium]